MTKIAIISQPEQGVLIDIGGCSTLQEATQHLTSTLQVSSQFWENMHVDLNLGDLALSKEEISQIMSIVAEVGVEPRHIYAQLEITRASLNAHNIAAAAGSPMNLLPSGSSDRQSSVEALEDFAPDTVQSALSPGEASPAAASESRETIVVAVESTIDSALPLPAPSEAARQVTAPAVLCLRQTLRSGQAVSHGGHLVIIGDVNPGAEVMAEGDITIWGALRGMAHAGIAGNTSAEIRALKLQPIQLRIAHAIARSPDRPQTFAARSSAPETARIVNGTIRITSSAPE